MNSALSFLFLALVVGLATGNPAPQDTYSSIRPNVSLTYREANGFQLQKISYSGHSESFPTEWMAVFINPVDRPTSSNNTYDILLAHMDEDINWSLTPNPSTPFNAWNVQIKMPKEWKINHSMGKNSVDINGSLMATVYLMPTNAGTKIVQSHFGNYLDKQPVALEVDPTMIVSIIYNNNKLLVSFSTRRQKNYPYKVTVNGNNPNHQPIFLTSDSEGIYICRRVIFV